MNLIKKLVLVMGVITSLVFSVFGMKFGSKGSLVCSYSLEENIEKLYEYYLKYGETKTLALLKEISDDELLPFDKFRLTKSYQYMQVVMGAGEGRVCMGFGMYTLRNGNQLPAHDYLLVPVEDVPIGYDLKVKLTDTRLSDGEVECKGVWSDSQMYLYATELDFSVENDWYMAEIIDNFWKEGRIDPMRRWIVLQGKKERIYGYGSFRLSLEGTNLVSDKIYLCGTYGEFEDKLYTTKAAFRGIIVQQPDCFFEYSRNGADSISWVFSFWNDFGTDGIETFSIKTPGAGTLVVEESWGETMIHEKCERAKVFNIPTDGNSDGFLDSFTRIAFFPANVRSVEIAAFFGEPEVIESGSGTNDEIISNVDIYRGFVIGTGVYKAGEVTTLRAISGPGQVFDRWDIPKGVSIPNGFEATNPNLSFVVPDDWCGTELEAKRIFLTAHWVHNPNAYIGVFDEIDQKVKVSVRFEPMGGEVTPMTRLVESESNIGALPTPMRSKYKFLGWYTAPEGGTKISATTKVTSDVTYYAQWVYDGSATVSVVVAEGCEAMGKVTGGKTAKAGTKLTLKATANKGYVFMGWYEDEACTKLFSAPGVDYTKVSVKHTVVDYDQTLYAKFKSDEPEGGDGVEVLSSYGPFTPGVEVALNLELVGYTAKKLPSGLKLDKKTGIVKGKATKPGEYEVTFTKKGAETLTAKFIVGPMPTITITMEGDTDKCKVTGASKPGKGYLVGKKVSLSAKGPKGTAFTGWFNDGAPWPNATEYLESKLKYVMTEENLSLVARFEKEKMSVSCDGLSALAVGEEVSIPIAIETQSGVKSVKGSKLPTGLKVKKDKVTGEWFVTGKPKKVGTWNATIKVTAKSGAVEQLPVAVTVEDKGDVVLPSANH